MQEIHNNPIHPSGVKVPKWLIWLLISIVITLILIALGQKWGILGFFLLLPLKLLIKDSNTNE